MKILHFDCFAGISGDMTLGALADMGLDTNLLRSELVKLGIGGWDLRFVPDERGGIHGTHAVVDLEGHEHIAHEHPHDHPHEHAHDHEHHHHDHGEPDHDHAHHNSWKEIRSLIEKSGISEGAKNRALKIFTLIAEAEAHVHGVAVDDVTFHEVGALDSIIDVVGAAIALDMLKPDKITCGEVELGGGMVKCAHGLLPVPAPATLTLVRGMPVKTGGFDKEMTTPTGAAILAASVDEFILARKSNGIFTEQKTGYGIGTRRMDRPNFLRVSWRESVSGSDAGTGALGAAESAGSGLRPWKSESLTMLEANIDDMSGEALGFFMEKLFEAGALDVTFSPCVMKKSRPGTIASVLGNPARLDSLRECFFRHSSTIGFRETTVNRLSLERTQETRKGGFGEVRVKTVDRQGAPSSKIEFEDRARIARERGISLEEAERLIRGDRGTQVP